MTKFTFFKTLILALALLVGNAAWGQYSGTGTFSKITSLSELTNGYYVIVNSGDGFAMNNSNGGSYFTNTAITPVSGKITNPANTIVWKIESHLDGGFTIFNEQSSKYVSYTGSSNAAYAVDAVTTGNQRWNVSYASNVFTFANAVLTTRILQYNSGSPRFACYTGSQQYLLLYKMDAASTTAAATPSITATGDQKATDNYFNTASITLSSSTDGASIYYTTNGDAPTTSSTLYTAPFDITSSTTIKAIAVKSGMDNSTVSEKTITISVSTPVATAASSISNSGFTANWDAVPAATEYELSVYTKSSGGTNTSDLIISEYIEGSSYNKAIEIFNGTGTDVDLSNYTIKKQANGAGEYGSDLALTGTLVNNDVFVICYVSGSNAADQSIRSVSDLETSSSAINYNGNDAIALFKGIGKIDEVGIFNQTASWGSNLTLIRKSSVSAALSTYDANEWNTEVEDYVTNLGTHTFAGTESSTPISNSPFTVTGANSKVITGLTANTNYFYKVIAKNGSAASAVSNEISVTTDTTTDLSTPTQRFHLRVINGNIQFNATSGKVVNVYNSVGQRVTSAITTEGNNTIPVSVKGIVFVQIGSEIAKLIVE